MTTHIIPVKCPRLMDILYSHGISTHPEAVISYRSQQLPKPEAISCENFHGDDKKCHYGENTKGGDQNIEECIYSNLVSFT